MIYQIASILSVPCQSVIATWRATFIIYHRPRIQISSSILILSFRANTTGHSIWIQVEPMKRDEKFASSHAEIEGFLWSKTNKGGQLGVKQKSSGMVLFMGFKDTVRVLSGCTEYIYIYATISSAVSACLSEHQTMASTSIHSVNKTKDFCQHVAICMTGTVAAIQGTVSLKTSKAYVPLPITCSYPCIPTSLPEIDGPHWFESSLFILISDLIFA